jgi:hypothetical protein
MRRRSESFYAKTEEEFKEQIVEETERPRKRSRISDLIEDSLDETQPEKPRKKDRLLDHEDNLGVSENFCIIENNTMEDEELIIINSIYNLDQSIKTKDKQLFLDNISTLYLSQRSYNLSLSSPSNRLNRSLSLDSINILDFDSIYPSTMPNTNDILINSILNDPIVSQNIKLTDEVLKIIVLGDDCIGKTLFIDKLFNKERAESPYLHSRSLDIRKKRVKLLDRIVTLEFWDTNKEIQNSKLCESKIYINRSLCKIMRWVCITIRSAYKRVNILYRK